MTQKFASRMQNRKQKDRRPKAKTDFGIQMLEKQRVRFFYGIGERQFSKYVKNVIASKSPKPVESLHECLESRLDNVIYRLHLAPSRQAARQMVGHGHILVNGRKTNIPSYQVSPGDSISIREGSAKSPLFTSLKEKLKEEQAPDWLTFDGEKMKAEVLRKPDMAGGKSLFDIAQVLEFYKR